MHSAAEENGDQRTPATAEMTCEERHRPVTEPVIRGSHLAECTAPGVFAGYFTEAE